ncbi:hypothetical protein GCM10027203_29800 [Nonomuraea fastidiosa]
MPYPERFSSPGALGLPLAERALATTFIPQPERFNPLRFTHDLRCARDAASPPPTSVPNEPHRSRRAAHRPRKEADDARVRGCGRRATSRTAWIKIHPLGRT